MDTVFVLTLFCVFAMSVLMSLILGTRTYSAINERADETYYRRTAISYIVEKVRHNDNTDTVFISSFCDAPALEFRMDIEGESYSTYLYYYEGNICELFCETGLDLPADAGSEIIAASALSFEAVGENLLSITYTDPAGLEGSATIALRSKEALG